VRDVYTTDVDRIIVDNKEWPRRCGRSSRSLRRAGKNKVELYEEPTPLFHKYNIEKDIELMYTRHVPCRAAARW